MSSFPSYFILANSCNVDETRRREHVLNTALCRLNSTSPILVFWNQQIILYFGLLWIKSRLGFGNKTAHHHAYPRILDLGRQRGPSVPPVGRLAIGQL